MEEKEKFVTQTYCDRFHQRQATTIKWILGLALSVTLAFAVPLSCASYGSMERIAKAETRIENNAINIDKMEARFDRFEAKLDQVYSVLVEIKQKQGGNE